MNTDSAWASLEITREGTRLSTATAVMPVWTNTANCASGVIEIKVPLLGIETNANNENDIQESLNEAFSCFCILAEEEGIGLDDELRIIGWEKSESSTASSMVFEIGDANPIFRDMAATGETITTEYANV